MKLVTGLSYDELRYVSELVSQLKSAVNDEKSWNEKYAWMEGQIFAIDNADLITTAINGKEGEVASTSFRVTF